MALPPLKLKVYAAAHTSSVSVAAGAHKYEVVGTSQKEADASVQIRSIISRSGQLKRQEGSFRHVNAIETHKESDSITPRQVLHLVHRAAVLAAAVLYLQICVSACVDILHEIDFDYVIPSAEVPSELPSVSLVLGDYVGSAASILESSLVTKVLRNDTTPRNGTLYLDSNTATSFTGCSSAIVTDTYRDTFQREAFAELVSDTAHNLTFLDAQTSELIFPIVDCSFSSITEGDSTAVRFFFLLRAVSNASDVSLLIVSMSMQDYKIVGQAITGAAAVATLVQISDLKATSLTHYFAVAIGYPYQALEFDVYQYESTTSDSFWQLKQISSGSAVDKHIQTACRTGFYGVSETNQCNIKNLLWALPNDPLDVVKYWQWNGRPTVRNASAWVHTAHFFLAADIIIQLLLLVLVSCNHTRKGALWIGDAFLTISIRVSFLGPTVLISWILEEGWTIMELAIYDGNAIIEDVAMYVHVSIARADLMALCLSLVSILSLIVKERIDPAVCMLAFYLTFEYRVELLQWAPSLADYVSSYADEDYNLAINEAEDVSIISPVKSWSAHKLTSRPIALMLSSVCMLVTVFLSSLLLYSIGRKIYRHYYPDKLHVLRTTADRSEDEAHLMNQLRTITIFELATGAQLLDHYGLLSDYQNYVFKQGVKYATADGIFSSGFVIANDRFVVATRDLVTIWLIKLTGVRFADVYVYILKDKTVQSTAQLVHPNTLSVRDLLNVSVSKLL